MLTVNSLLDISSFSHRDIFQECEFVWDALKKLKYYMNSLHYPNLKTALTPEGKPLEQTVILSENTLLKEDGAIIEFGNATKGELKVYKNGQLLKGASVIMAGTVLIGDKISIGKGVLIEAGALIKSPTIIGDLNEIRQGAYIRGYCLTGKGCVIGHVTEVKHTLFLDGAKAGHFAYLGDSIIGNHTNLGAGTKLANLRFTEGEVPVKTPDGRLNTGLRKLGAIFGDHVQTGCNSVTNPGTILGKRSIVMPNTTVPSGYHAHNSLIR